MKRRNLIIAALIIFALALVAYFLLRPTNFVQEKMRISLAVPNGWEAVDEYIPNRRVIFNQVSTSEEDQNLIGFSIFEIRAEELEGYEGEFELEVLKPYIVSHSQSIIGVEVSEPVDFAIDGVEGFSITTSGTERQRVSHKICWRQ